MSWKGVITNAGAALLDQWALGGTLAITSAATGTGTVSESAMIAQTSLVSGKQTASIISSEKLTAGIKLKLQITAPRTSYLLQQYGVWASLSGETAVLLALFQNPTGITIPSSSESPDFVYTLFALMKISNTGELTVTVDTSALVSQGTLDEAMATKVDKVSGKGLSTNDYTTAEKNKLAGIEAEANKYTHPAYTARTGKPTGNLTPGFGDTVTVSQITSDATGHVTGATDRTVKIPATEASTSAAGLMSAADKTKLNGVATGAEVNQNAFANVKVGSTTVAADAEQDTLELVAGSNITITPDATNDKVTIATTAEVNQNAFSNVKVGSTTIAADSKTDTLTLVAGDNITLTPNATNDSVTIAATDTTYSSKAAASGGTAISLVTTGEKYTWNNKQNKLTFDTTPTAGSSNPVTSEGIKTALDGKSNTSHTHDNLYYKLTNGTEIPSGADLDDATYRTPGNYTCETNAKARTIKHFPGYDDTTLVSTRANAFKLFVGYAQGGSNYIAQELRDYFTGAVYYRWYYSSWTAWRAVRGTASVLISELDTITNNIKDSTLISTSDANGETGIWYKRAATTFWNYIKSKADAVYAAINHTHAASDIASGTLAAARLPTATASAQGAVKLGASGGAAAYRHTHSANDVTDLVTATAYGPAELVSFQDAHGGLPLKKCLVSIMPAQSGSGNPTPANVRPISGREHVKVWRFGKNFSPQADVVVASGTGNETIYFPQPLPAGTYVFSADLTSTYNGNCIAHIIRADNTTITVTGTPGTRAALSFTSPSGNEIIGIRFYVGSNWATSYSNSGAWSNIQVETGSTATAYEASETVVDADLPELVYGGTLDVLTGKLTVTHGYIKPTEYTGSSISDTTVVVFTRIPLGKRGTSYNIVSNVATGAAATDANIARYGYIVRQSISSVDERPLLSIAASTTAHPTTASLSQALLDADACFAYELETPEVYQLTPSQVASLAGQNHIWADTGNITVEYGAFLQALEGAAENHVHDAEDIASGILPVERGGTGNSTGYVTAGQEAGTTLGECATAEGIETLSTGKASHSEGIASSASGEASHAEGHGSALGAYSHAEGNARARGKYAHAEGYSDASGEYSHVEGKVTVAAGDCQHVFGQFNSSDTTSVEIVGWGSTSASKNIRTLDRSGNMTIAGTLTQSSDARLKDVQGEVPDVSGIRAVRFKWNDTNGEHDDRDHIGYLAQEVEKIAPFLVGTDSNGYKSLDYIALLCAKVEWLERRVAELEGRG